MTACIISTVVSCLEAGVCLPFNVDWGLREIHQGKTDLGEKKTLGKNYPWIRKGSKLYFTQMVSSDFLTLPDGHLAAVSWKDASTKRPENMPEA